MPRFHEDGINWGNFTLRQTLYNPDEANGDPLSNMDPNHFFNLPISEIKNRFNAESGQKRRRPVYNHKKHSFITNTVHQLCRKAGVSMVSVVKFKTDKVGASTSPGIEIDVSEGAIQSLNKSEMKALLAHEVAHSVINEKHVNTVNEETAADVIGARLSSENDMINLIRYFEKHVKVASTGDEAHYSDAKRIAEIKQAFKAAKVKLRQINHLKLKVEKARQRNQHLKRVRALRHRLQAVHQHNVKLKNKLSRRQNHNLR